MASLVTTTVAGTLAVKLDAGLTLERTSVDSRFRMFNTGGEWILASTYGSTGAYDPIKFQTSDVTRLTIAANGAATFSGAVGVTGNFGIGMTPNSGTSPLVINNSASDYLVGLYRGTVSEWWFKVYANGNFAIHENGVGDKFTIAAGGAATFAGALTVSGTALFSDGLVGSPSISFAGDTDTGIWRPGSNQLWFVTTGVNRLKLDGSGNAEFTGALTGTTATFSGNVGGVGLTLSDGWLELYNANVLQLYSTPTTAGANYETFALDKPDAGNARLRVYKSGTGTYRGMEFQTGGSARLTISAAGAATFSGALTVGTTTSIGQQVFVQGSANSGEGATVTFKRTTTTAGHIGTEGGILGTVVHSNNICIFGVGNNVSIYGGNQATNFSTFNSSGLAVTGTGTFTGALTIGAYTLPNTDGTTGYHLQTNGSGTVTWQPGGGGTVTGSGTDNYIPRWNGTTALHNSIIYDSGASVGISSVAFSSPAGTLHTQAVGSNITYLDAYSATPGTGSMMIFRKSASATVGKTQTGNGDSLGTFTFYGVNSNPSPDWGLGAAINISQEGTSGASYVPAHMAFSTCTASAYGERMRIASDGNVGIGTNDPSTKLQVNDTNDSRLLIYETGATPYTATLELASQVVGTYGALIQYTSAAERLTIQAYGRTASNNSNQGGIGFKTKLNNTTPTEVVSIHGFSGNVGIGITVPTAKLHVQGTIRMGTGSYMLGEATSGIRLNNSADTLNLIVARNDGDVHMPGRLAIGGTTHVAGKWLTVIGPSSFSDSIVGTSATFTGAITGLSLATSAATGVVATAAGGGWYPAFHSKNTNADSAPSYITLEKISASPANGDYIGGIVMKGRTSTAAHKSYVEQWCRAMVVTNGSESSRWNCGTWGAGTEYPNTLVCDAGNVGIGTASPGSPLHLSATKDGGWLSQFYNAGAGGDANGLLLQSGTSGNEYIFKAVDKAGTTIGLAVRADGNVGIGTSAPAATLDVRRISAAASKWIAAFCSDNQTLATARAHDSVLIQASDVPCLKIYEAASTPQVVTLAVGDGNATLASSNTLRFYVNGSNTGDGYNGLGGTEAITINTSGSVGIGTPPLSGCRLRLAGGTYPLRVLAGSTEYFFAANILYFNSSSYAYIVNQNASLMLGAHNYEVMRLNGSSGGTSKAGINETSPDANLHVTGRASYTTASLAEVSGLGFVRFQPSSTVEDSIWIHNGGGHVGFQGTDNPTTDATVPLTLNAYGGSVGIGTATPSKLFHVYGNSLLQGQLDVGGNFVSTISGLFDLGTSSLKWRDLNLSGTFTGAGGVSITGSSSFQGASFSSGITGTSATLSSSIVVRGLAVVGSYTTASALQFEAPNNGSSFINFYDNNASEGCYIKSTGQTYGGRISFGARWDDHEDKIVFDLAQASAGAAYHARVGIGLTAPSTVLHIKGATQDSGKLLIESGTLSNNNRATLFMSSVNVNGNTGNVSIECIHPNNQQSELVMRTGATDATTFGTERIRITTDGNVGIGTDNPGELLQVKGNMTLRGATNLRYKIANDSNNNWAEIGNDGATAQNTLEFFTGSSSTASMTIDNSGDVGINQTSPDSWLHIEDDNTPTKHLLHLKGGGASGAYGMLVEAANGNDLFKIDTLSYKVTMPSGYSVGIGNDAPVSLLHVQKYDSGNYTGEVRVGGSSTAHGILTSYTQLSSTEGSIHVAPGYTNANALFKLRCSNGDTNQLVLKGDGKVGIGTAEPYRDLQVGASSGNLRVGGGAGLDILHDNSGLTTADIKQLYADNNAGAHLRITGGFTTFCTGTDGAEKVRIQADGNVGIGTTAPAATLHVRDTTASTSRWTAAFVADNAAIVSAQAHDHVLIQSNDVPSLKLYEYGQDQVGGIAVGDNNCTIASTETLRFYVNGSATDNIYNGLAGTRALLLSTSGAATFVGSVTAVSFSGNGASISAINALNISSGTVATARLGSGTANSSTFLRGDNTWATPADAQGVTNITVGDGLQTTSGATPNITLDLDEVNNSGTLIAGDKLVTVDGTATTKSTISGIPLSIFNNNAGWTSNAGDITSVGAALGLSGGGTSGSVSLALDLNELVDSNKIAAGDKVAFVDVNASSQSAICEVSDIPLSVFDNDSGWITSNWQSLPNISSLTALP